MEKRFLPWWKEFLKHIFTPKVVWLFICCFVVRAPSTIVMVYWSILLFYKPYIYIIFHYDEKQNIYSSICICIVSVSITVLAIFTIIIIIFIANDLIHVFTNSQSSYNVIGLMNHKKITIAVFRMGVPLLCTRCISLTVMMGVSLSFGLQKWWHRWYFMKFVACYQFIIQRCIQIWQLAIDNNHQGSYRAHSTYYCPILPW